MATETMTTTHDTECVICHLEQQATQDWFTRAMAEATVTVFQPVKNKKVTMTTVLTVYLTLLFTVVTAAAYRLLLAQRRPCATPSPST